MYRTWSDFKQTRNYTCLPQRYSYLWSLIHFLDCWLKAAAHTPDGSELFRLFLCSRPMLFLLYVFVVSICWYSFHSLIISEYTTFCKCFVISAPPLPACHYDTYQWSQEVEGAGVRKKTGHQLYEVGHQRTERAPQRAPHYVLTTAAAHFIMFYLPQGHPRGHFQDFFFW